MFCAVNAIIQPTPQNSSQGFAAAFPAISPVQPPQIQTDTSGYNTTRDTLEGIHAPGRAQKIPDTTATPRRWTGQHRPPIIIRYIRWCSISQTMPAAAGQRLHLYRVSPAACSLAPGQRSGRGILAPSTRRTVQQQGQRRAARSHWRLAPHFFSGFRPIANRGQQ